MPRRRAIPSLIWDLVVQPLSGLARAVSGIIALFTVVLPAFLPVLGWPWSVSALLLVLLAVSWVALHRLGQAAYLHEPPRPQLPPFLEYREGPRNFSSRSDKPARRTRYMVRVPSVSAWDGPRRLDVRCTGSIVEPELWVDKKPMTPSQCLAGNDSFLVDLEPDSARLVDGVQIFILYYHHDPDVWIRSAQPYSGDRFE